MMELRQLSLVFFVLVLAGCAPVMAYDCTVYADRRGAPHLRATLTNTTGATVRDVGVFVYTTDGFADYQFDGTLGPHETVRNRSGFEYAPGANGGDHFSKIISCYARAARYANGEIWMVSPL
jgi:hypothetical protein